MVDSPNLQMRHEAMFSGRSAYDILVLSDVLQHREAARRLGARLDELRASRSDARASRSAGPGEETRGSRPAEWRDDAPASRRAEPGAAEQLRKPLRVLDLACGHEPHITAGAMRAHPEQSFEYTGVDINPQQIGLAAEYEFPANVVTLEFIEGSAWDLSHLANRGPQDLVFVGLNWHHGTPEEIRFLADQVRGLLAPGGLLVNHDCYRPEETAYLRRPRTGLENGDEVSLDQVDRDIVAAAGVSGFDFEEAPADDDRPAWKLDMIDRLEVAYRQHGGTNVGARILRDHSWFRDYPVSVREACAVLVPAGFDVKVERYGPDVPLAAYLALITARPR